MISRTKKKLLIIAPFLDREKGNTFNSWAKDFEKFFMLSGWETFIFPYRKVWLDAANPFLPFVINKKYQHFVLGRILSKTIRKFSPDWIFVHKGELLPTIINRLKKKNSFKVAFYNPDDPMLFMSLGREYASFSDLVFTSSTICQAMYGEIGTKAIYLPFWAINTKLYDKSDNLKNSQSTKLFDITFISSYQLERDCFLQHLIPQLEKRNIRIKIWGDGWENSSEIVRNKWSGYCVDSVTEFRQIVLESKINLNIHHTFMKHGGMQSNHRNYEILSFGGFVLTDYAVGLQNLFQIGKDLVVYSDVDDCIEKIEFFLANENERDQISKHGCESVHRLYSLSSWINRVSTELASF